MPTNRLAGEKSPYLLQHAHNPVDWFPWGEEAFQQARTQDKPIFLSIGYSTCHWCHVMERESFESDSVAEVLNRHFIPVKVDREERPDVDRIYMMFVQATTGAGGWPMSVWLTPDRKPFFGGTYFPPDNRYGRPGFRAILESIANAWANERAKILESSTDIVEQMKKQAEVRPGQTNWLDESILEAGFNVFRRTHDPRLGGFGQAPKFPRPVAHNFLLRYWKRTGNQEALDMVLLTLREMARGGMNDQLGGGFHRYSVDERWFVPHFEKMLYDQAQLAVSYLEAFQITGEEIYAAAARDIFEYVLRDMTHSGGAFFSAEDADSVIDPADPHHKGEGAFYIWSQAELDQILGEEVSRWFAYRYGVEPSGNVHADPHQEFTGRNILYQAHSIEEAARHFQVDESQLRMALASSAGKLMKVRDTRVRPHLDDKILTSWNGLMISAFALGAQALGEPRYAEAARRAADLILANMYDPSSHRLLRRWREGEAAIDGFLDDYAFLALALADLYETVFDLRYLETAVALGEAIIHRFEDTEHGAFFSTTGVDASLVVRMKEDYDGAEPSGNSMATLALLRLAQFTDSEPFRAAAGRALKAFAPRLRAAPHGVPQMLVAYMLSESKPPQIILAGEKPAPMLAAAGRRFVPGRTLIHLNDAAAQAWFAERIPVTATMTAQEGRLTGYVCQNYSCQLPVTDIDAFTQLLE
ncbi:MAG: thioredoxin domain-containing protein [Acidimicrobiia bacterium]|nr:thioredoxin domain-containing protein [Acidimicrobiia bacterium]